jgi:hypothetical protein
MGERRPSGIPKVRAPAQGGGTLDNKRSPGVARAPVDEAWVSGMAKTRRNERGRAAPRGAVPPVLSTEAQEVRALLRRVPDGLQAALAGLAARPAELRERILAELVRALGRDMLPLLRAAALGGNEELACAALTAAPLLATRPVGDLLSEVYHGYPEAQRGRVAAESARALQARGIRVDVPEQHRPVETRLTIRSAFCTLPDRYGTETVAVRLQDVYGVWHAIFVYLEEDRGIRDAFLRPFSEREWRERVEQPGVRSLPLEPCPVDYVRWLVARAREQGSPISREARPGIEAWDRWVGPPPEGQNYPDVATLAGGLDDEARAAARAALVEVLELPGLARWLYAGKDHQLWFSRWLQELNRLSDRAEIGTVLRGRPGPESIEAVLREAAEKWVDDAAASTWRARLARAATTLAVRGAEQPARTLAAEWSALEAGEPRSAGEFYRHLCRRTMVLLFADTVRRDPRQT